MPDEDFQPTSESLEEIKARMRPTYVSTRPRTIEEPAPKPAPKASAKTPPKAE